MLKTLHSEQKAWKTTWGARNVHKYVHDVVRYGPAIDFLWNKITIVRRQVPWNPSRPQCQPFLHSYSWSWNWEYLSNSLLLVDKIAQFFSNSFEKHQKLDMVGWLQVFSLIGTLLVKGRKRASSLLANWRQFWEKIILKKSGLSPTK